MLEKATPAREGLLDRHDRRRPRDDRGRGRVGGAAWRSSTRTARDLAKLADPRTIKHGRRAGRRSSSAQSTPIYYITGTIHSPETGAPTALMELAYRLAVDESPYIKNDPRQRDHADHADRRSRRPRSRWSTSTTGTWRIPDENWPQPRLLGPLRRARQQSRRDGRDAEADARTCSTPTSTGSAQVLHDLHESVPYLYDNTIGDGPYNAWIDPILDQRVADDRLEQRVRR